MNANMLFKKLHKHKQTDYRTEVIDKSDNDKNILNLRQTNLRTEKRADRKK